MNIKKTIALIVSVLLLLSLVACGGEKADDSSSATYSPVESESTFKDDKEDKVDNNSSEPQSSQEDTTSNQESQPTTDSTSSTESTVSVEEPNTNVTTDGKEIYGSGTKDDPYLDTPDAESHTVKTLSIPAGKSVFYSIYRVGGKILSINDANAFVVCDGTKHTAQNGKVSFKVVDALASDAITFEIGNTGSADKSFTITFTDLEGSMENPTVIKSIGTEITLKLEEGNEVGHFYNYIAEQAGTLKLYLLSETEKGILLATNNSSSAQRSTDEDTEVKSDDTGTYIELEVKKGDKIIIHVGSKPNKRGKYPATEIKWIAKY